MNENIINALRQYYKNSRIDEIEGLVENKLTSDFNGNSNLCQICEDYINEILNIKNDTIVNLRESIITYNSLNPSDEVVSELIHAYKEDISDMRIDLKKVLKLEITLSTIEKSNRNSYDNLSIILQKIEDLESKLDEIIDETLITLSRNSLRDWVGVLPVVMPGTDCNSTEIAQRLDKIIRRVNKASDFLKEYIENLEEKSGKKIFRINSNDKLDKLTDKYKSLQQVKEDTENLINRCTTKSSIF